MEFLVKPIGTFCCDFKYKQDMPRQGVLNKNSTGTITIDLENTPQCLNGLDGFSHIWLIYIFHKNTNWKPMVSPPRISPKKVGVLASRSPYRPNQIGMSLVKLESIKNNIITVSEFDLINETPIIDIKPYIEYSDSRAESKSGWVTNETAYKINLSKKLNEQCLWLYQEAELDFKQIIKTQLEFKPFDKNLKRVSFYNDIWTLSYRTWRIQFKEIDTDSLNVLGIFSGYSNSELNSVEDPYKDKDLHKKFSSYFNN